MKKDTPSNYGYAAVSHCQALPFNAFSFGTESPGAWCTIDYCGRSLQPPQPAGTRPVTVVQLTGKPDAGSPADGQCIELGGPSKNAVAVTYMPPDGNLWPNGGVQIALDPKTGESCSATSRHATFNYYCTDDTDGSSGPESVVENGSGSYFVHWHTKAACVTKQNIAKSYIRQQRTIGALETFWLWGSVVPSVLFLLAWCVGGSLITLLKLKKSNPSAIDEAKSSGGVEGVKNTIMLLVPGSYFIFRSLPRLVADGIQVTLTCGKWRPTFKRNAGVCTAAGGTAAGLTEVCCCRGRGGGGQAGALLDNDQLGGYGSQPGGGDGEDEEEGSAAIIRSEVETGAELSVKQKKTMKTKKKKKKTEKKNSRMTVLHSDSDSDNSGSGDEFADF